MVRTGERSDQQIRGLKKGWNIFTTILLVAAALLAAAFLLPRVFGIQLYMVTSGSMEPEYPVGSLIYVQKVEPEEIQVGDVITFIMPGSDDTAATHQVREIDSANEQVYTQGINNRDQDGNILPDAAPVPYRSIIGKPMLCVPVLGHVNRFCTTSPGMFVILGVLVAVIGVSILLEYAAPEKEKAKSRRRKRRKRH